MSIILKFIKLIYKKSIPNNHKIDHLIIFYFQFWERAIFASIFFFSYKKQYLILKHNIIKKK